MQYALEKIDTVAGCDILLTVAQEKKQKLERKRRNLGESIDTFHKRLDNLSQESAVTQLLLGMLTATYHALPEGKDKASLNVEVKRLELRKARLDLRALKCNERSLLAKQIKYNMLDNQVVALDNYIAAVQNHKIVLANTPLRLSPAVAALRPPISRQNLRSQKRLLQLQARFATQKGVRQKHDIENPIFPFNVVEMRQEIGKQNQS